MGASYTRGLDGFHSLDSAFVSGSSDHLLLSLRLCYGLS